MNILLPVRNRFSLSPFHAKLTFTLCSTAKGHLGDRSVRPAFPLPPYPRPSSSSNRTPSKRGQADLTFPHSLLWAAITLTLARLILGVELLKGPRGSIHTWRPALNSFEMDHWSSGTVSD